MLLEYNPRYRVALINKVKAILRSPSAQQFLQGVNTLASIPENEIDTYLVLLKQLHTPQMDNEQKLFLMCILEDIDAEKREEFVEETSDFYEGELDEKGIVDYIYTFADSEGYLNTLGFENKSSHTESAEEEHEEENSTSDKNDKNTLDDDNTEAPHLHLPSPDIQEMMRRLEISEEYNEKIVPVF